MMTSGFVLLLVSFHVAVESNSGSKAPVAGQENDALFWKEFFSLSCRRLCFSLKTSSWFSPASYTALIQPTLSAAQGSSSFGATPWNGKEVFTQSLYLFFGLPLFRLPLASSPYSRHSRVLHTYDMSDPSNLGLDKFIKAGP